MEEGDCSGCCLVGHSEEAQGRLVGWATVSTFIGIGHIYVVTDTGRVQVLETLEKPLKFKSMFSRPLKVLEFFFFL